jgi:Leucine-rich repeat (LRR) protein
MSSLRSLNLSGNQLEGLIPTSLSNISTLEVLDLAKNNLSGQIPEELSKLHWLHKLDVSSNSLCGPIPTGTQFSTFDATSFQRNKCLWGCPLDHAAIKRKTYGRR